MTESHWISIAQVVATAFVGIVAGLITWKMQSKQIDIAKGLQDIARGQHETAATKLRLELFEKRFKAYENLVIALEKIHNFDYYQNHEDVISMYEEFKRARAPIRYLFDDSVYAYLKDDLTVAVKTFLVTFEPEIKRDGITHEDIFPTNRKDFEKIIARSFRILEEMIGPMLYVDKKKEKPLIEQEDQS